MSYGLCVAKTWSALYDALKANITARIAIRFMLTSTLQATFYSFREDESFPDRQGGFDKAV